MKRTPDFEVDQSFDVAASITKAWQDPATGKRWIRGVASGVGEDRDGERCSKRAIASMAAQATDGGAVKLCSTHDQDWLSEMGDVQSLHHDPETDELIYEGTLADGDPIADKAWTALTVEGKQLGASIGGKLKKAYFELVDTAKSGGAPAGKPRRRKVLDDVHLRHIVITGKPSYAPSFAQAIAKTFDPGKVDDKAFTLDVDDKAELADATVIYKAAKLPTDDPAETPGPGEGPPGDGDGDQPAPEQAPAGVPDANPAPEGAGPEDPAAAEPSDAEEAQNLPMVRHLACPNCGAEFASPLPTEKGDLDDNRTTTDPDDPARTARKTETPMPASTKETIAKIRTLADELAAAVEKTDPPAAAETEPVVAKTTTDTDGDVAKVEALIAASHQLNEQRVDELTEATTKGFEEVVKAVKAIGDRVAAQPNGRKSVARVVENDVSKKVTGDAGGDDWTDHEFVAKKIDEASNGIEALKVLNKATAAGYRPPADA